MPAAYSGLGDLDGLELWARIDIGKDSNGEDKNDIRQPVTRDHRDYVSVMGGVAAPGYVPPPAYAAAPQAPAYAPQPIAAVPSSGVCVPPGRSEAAVMILRPRQKLVRRAQPVCARHS